MNQNQRPPKPPTRAELDQRVDALEAAAVEQAELIADLDDNLVALSVSHDALAARLALLESATTIVTVA